MIAHISPDDLSARLDDALSPARRDQVDAHLVTCADCRAALEGLRWAVSYVHAMPVVSMPPGTSLHVPLAPRAAPRATVLRRPWHPVLSTLGAGLAVVVIGAALVLRGQGTGGTVGTVHLENTTGGGSAAPGMVTPEVGVGAAVAVPGLAYGNHITSSLVGPFAGVPEMAVPTPDDDSAGYPVPLATAREAEVRMQGGVAPPPEVGVTGPSAGGAAPVPSRVPAPTADTSALPAPAAAATGPRVVHPSPSAADSVTTPRPTAAVTGAGPGSPPGTRRGPFVPLVLLAGALIALSGLALSRARHRRRR
jgi:hypothetical protein